MGWQYASIDMGKGAILFYGARTITQPVASLGVALRVLGGNDWELVSGHIFKRSSRTGRLIDDLVQYLSQEDITGIPEPIAAPPEEIAAPAEAIEQAPEPVNQDSTQGNIEPELVVGELTNLAGIRAALAESDTAHRQLASLDVARPGEPENVAAARRQRMAKEQEEERVQAADRKRKAAIVKQAMQEQW